MVHSDPNPFVFKHWLSAPKFWMAIWQSETWGHKIHTSTFVYQPAAKNDHTNGLASEVSQLAVVSSGGSHTATAEVIAEATKSKYLITSMMGPTPPPYTTPSLYTIPE